MKRLDPPLELVRGNRQLPDPADQISGDPCEGPVDPFEAHGDRLELLEPRERTRCRIPARVQFVQVPPQPVDLRHTVPDQVFSMVDQQSQIAGGGVQACDR